MTKATHPDNITLESAVLSSDSKINFKTIGLILPLLIFIFNPIFGISLAVLFALKYKSKLFLLNIILLISLFLGLINTTKVAESDMIGYEELFEYAKTVSFLDYANEFVKEPIYYVAMYVMSSVVGISFKWFVFLQTVVAYILFLFAIFRFQKKAGSATEIIIFSLLVGGLFFELFSLSAHLMRQFLATSMLLFYMVELCLYKTNRWWLLLLAVLTHSTVYLFILFIFIPVFRQKIEVVKLLLLLLLIVMPIYYLYENIVLFMAANLPTYFAYVFMRLAEGNFEDLTGSVQEITLIINIVSIALTAYYYLYSDNLGESSSGMYYFLNVFFGLLIFTLLVVDFPLISYRYSFYVYFFIPFIFPLLLRLWPLERFSAIFQFIVVGVLFIRFGYKLEYGTFTYESFVDAILRSSMNYI